MSDQPDKAGHPAPGDLPQTENLRGLYLFIDAVGDTTIRPIRSPMLKQIRPDQPPERPKPETK